MFVSFDIGTKHCALCVMDDEEVIRAWTVFEIDAPFDVDATRRALEYAFESIECVHTVVVERQPPHSSTMVRIQHYIEMFCAQRFRVPIVIMDPRHKLAFASTQPWYVPPASTSYRARKKAAIESVARYVAEYVDDPDVSSTFDQAQKRDDLADALLQVLAHKHMSAEMSARENFQNSV